MGTCEKAREYIEKTSASEGWAFAPFANAANAAAAIHEDGLQPGVIIFAPSEGSPLNAEVLEPLDEWSDEAMTCLFLMPHAQRPDDMDTELFDMILDTSLGTDGLLARLTPWMG